MTHLTPTIGTPRHSDRHAGQPIVARATLAASPASPASTSLTSVVVRSHTRTPDHATTYRNAILLARDCHKRAAHTLDPTTAERLSIEADGWLAVARLIAARAAMLPGI